MSRGSISPEINAKVRKFLADYALALTPMTYVGAKVQLMDPLFTYHGKLYEHGDMVPFTIPIMDEVIVRLRNRSFTAAVIDNALIIGWGHCNDD